MDFLTAPTPIERQAAAADYWLELTGKRAELDAHVKSASVREAFVKEARELSTREVRAIGAVLGGTFLGAKGAFDRYRSAQADESGTSKGERAAARSHDALASEVARELAEEGGGSRLKRLRLAYRALQLQSEQDAKQSPGKAALVSGLAHAGTGAVAGAVAAPRFHDLATAAQKILRSK